MPRGWTDFGRQLAIWFGFYFAYFGARSFADRNPAQAFWNGWRVLSFEQRTTHAIVETTTQQFVNSSHAQQAKFVNQWQAAFDKVAAGKAQLATPVTIQVNTAAIDAAAQSPIENINANAAILRDLNAADESTIARLQQMAIQHAKNSGF